MNNPAILNLATVRPVEPELLRRIRAVVFDWDGTAVPDRSADASDFIAVVEKLARAGIWVIVVTGTNFENIHRQFTSRVTPLGLSRVVVCTNRGSEVYEFDRDGRPQRIWQRVATAQEEARLTAIADAVKGELQQRTGLDIEVVYNRLNRRKIDLIPVPEWADPPKARIGELLVAVENRLRAAGLTRGLIDAIDLTRDLTKREGLPGARITSDVKHIEVGLTDKGDAVEWLKRHFLSPRHIRLSQVLLAGDEFGPIAGFSGSDDRMREEAGDALVVSVGREPNGVPEGVLHLQGGPPRFIDLLGQVLAAHSAGLTDTGLPQDLIDARPQPGWYLEDMDYEPAFEPELESRFALANGFIGLRGSLDVAAQASQPRTYVAGIFDLSDAPPYVATLVPGPYCLDLALRLDGEPLSIDKGRVQEHRRVLDMQRGTLKSTWSHQTESGKSVRLSSLRLVSLSQRNLGLQVVRVETSEPASIEIEAGVSEPEAGLESWKVEPGVGVWLARHSRRALAVATGVSFDTQGVPGDRLASRDVLHDAWSYGTNSPSVAELVHVFAVARDPDPRAASERARSLLPQQPAEAVRGIYGSHVQAWEERQRLSDFVIEGDEAAQRAMRFASYHLNSAPNPEDEHTSVSARSLTGDAYMGHVFWDTEIFLLPFYTFTWPAAARSMLMYRYHTLPAARTKAETLGYRGALYAWESAASGAEETPSMAFGPGGQIIFIRSGIEEHHISADVAYAVWQYWQATDDSDFLMSAGAEILLETSRFWASRARLEDDGKYHIRRVIGPDEYHEGVDDNAYTNEMARWNLEVGVEAAALVARRWPGRWRELSERLALAPVEIDQWRDISGRLVRSIDAASGLIEEFAGYFSLEDIDLRQFASRTAPMDVILGQARIKASRVIKQADVLMLLALLGDRFGRGVQEANFRYYEPRCGHGSSLSPPVHALVAARLGQRDLALRYFNETAAIDLGDAMGNTFGGVHIGALGGLWQAAVLGFAGLRLAQGGIGLYPQLPEGWGRISFRVQWRGRTVLVAARAQPRRLEVTLERGMGMKFWLDDESHQLRLGQTLEWRVDDGSQDWTEVRRAK